MKPKKLHLSFNLIFMLILDSIQIDLLVLQLLCNWIKKISKLQYKLLLPLSWQSENFKDNDDSVSNCIGQSQVKLRAALIEPLTVEGYITFSILLINRKEERRFMWPIEKRTTSEATEFLTGSTNKWQTSHPWLTMEDLPDKEVHETQKLTLGRGRRQRRRRIRS